MSVILMKFPIFPLILLAAAKRFGGAGSLSKDEKRIIRGALETVSNGITDAL
jgi:hypothetical protein